MRASKEQETPDLNTTSGLNYHGRGGELRLESRNGPGISLLGVPLWRHPARAVMTACTSLKCHYLICFDLAGNFSAGT